MITVMIGVYTIQIQDLENVDDMYSEFKVSSTDSKICLLLAKDGMNVIPGS
jgi:hypothetical protein